MIRIVQRIKLCPKIYDSFCSFCCADISFYSMSPVFCFKCQEELPNFSKLIEGVENRIDYFICGNNINSN
jgi:hypothetical protein